MKKLSFLRLIVLALLVGICAMPMDAASKKKKKKPAKKTAMSSKRYSDALHFVSMWGGGGYSGLIDGENGQTYNAYTGDVAGIQGTQVGFNSKFVGSGGGLIGVGYELHKKRFMFSVGPEFRLINTSDKFSFDYTNDKFPYAYFNDITDPFGNKMVMQYAFDKTRETQQIGQVTLPIMFGGNFDNVYFMLGAKIGYQLMGTYRDRDTDLRKEWAFGFAQHRGELTTTVYDPMAVDPSWEGIPSHSALQNYPLAEHPLYNQNALNVDNRRYGFSDKLPGLDAMLSAEFGINLNPFLSPEWNEKNEESKHPWRMRIGAFIDYGLPMLKAKMPESGMAYPNALNVANVGDMDGNKAVGFNPLMQTAFASDKMSSLLVGVKFTALFQVNKPKQPNPRIQFLVTDALTEKPIAGAKLAVQPEPKQGQRPRKPAIKTTKGGKTPGQLQQRYERGNYRVWPSGNAAYMNEDFFYYNGEESFDYITYEHTEDLRDTLHISLLKKPEMFLYVHDAATEQLIIATAKMVSAEHNDSVTLSSVADSKLIYAQYPTLHYRDHYTVRVTAPNYHDTTFVLPIKAGKDTTNVTLRPIKRIRRTLLLKNMFFATDKTDILELSEQDLQTLYKFLSENPKIRILITGHTDSQGSDSYNQKLSEGRAASVKAEMVKRGIDADRMETDGKGESEPIDTNDTEEGRQNNRRVQVTVLNAEDAVVDEY